MNYEKIYEYRFKGIDHAKKKIAWSEIAAFIYAELSKPEKVLDPAAGLCEFINLVPSQEKWAIDLNEEFIRKWADDDIKILIGDSLQLELPQDYFDAVFISNFLEHLHTQEEVALLLNKMFKSLRKGGKIAVMGPNFKYSYSNYFDFADHTVILSELGLSEHLYGAGFEIEKVIPRFLPLSFRGKFPVSKFLVKTYLAVPLFWKVFGKQFLVIGTKK